MLVVFALERTAPCFIWEIVRSGGARLATLSSTPSQQVVCRCGGFDQPNVTEFTAHESGQGCVHVWGVDKERSEEWPAGGNLCCKCPVPYTVSSVLPDHLLLTS